jgi:hypothetical protein
LTIASRARDSCSRARMLHDGILGARLVVVDGAGHTCIWAHHPRYCPTPTHSSMRDRPGDPSRYLLCGTLVRMLPQLRRAVQTMS